MCRCTHPTSTVNITNNDAAGTVQKILQYDFYQPNNCMEIVSMCRKMMVILHLWKLVFAISWKAVHTQITFNLKIQISLAMVNHLSMNGNVTRSPAVARMSDRTPP